MRDCTLRDILFSACHTIHASLLAVSETGAARKVIQMNIAFTCHFVVRAGFGHELRQRGSAPRANRTKKYQLKKHNHTIKNASKILTLWCVVGSTGNGSLPRRGATYRIGQGDREARHPQSNHQREVPAGIGLSVSPWNSTIVRTGGRLAWRLCPALATYREHCPLVAGMTIGWVEVEMTADG